MRVPGSFEELTKKKENHFLQTLPPKYLQYQEIRNINDRITKL